MQTFNIDNDHSNFYRNLIRNLDVIRARFASFATYIELMLLKALCLLTAAMMKQHTNYGFSFRAIAP